MKSIFLYIITFVLAVGLALFSSYFIVQKVYGTGGVVGFGSDIDMLGHKIKNVGPGIDLMDGVTFGQFNDAEAICLESGGTRGADAWCILSWCELNNFDFCGDPGAPGCFTPDIPILMADNKYKPIKDVKQGDWVLTKENETSDKMIPAKVVKTFEHTVSSYLIINNNLKATDIHPIFVNGEWKQAKAIELGERLLNEKGQEVIVESLETKNEIIKVYNLEIEDYSTYFAGGVYVHNKPIDEPPEQ